MRFTDKKKLTPQTVFYIMKILTVKGSFQSCNKINKDRGAEKLTEVKELRSEGTS